MEVINYNYKILEKKINLGIEVLRMILSFFIVVIHCCNSHNSNLKILHFHSRYSPFYVPTFFLISFFFFI